MTALLNRRGVLSAVAVVAATLAGTGRAEATNTGQAAFERAMLDYERQRFAAAYQALQALADQGHAEAARVALLMAAHGPRLYGMRFAIDESQRQRWLVVALPPTPGTATAAAH